MLKHPVFPQQGNEYIILMKFKQHPAQTGIVKLGVKATKMKVARGQVIRNDTSLVEISLLPHLLLPLTLPLSFLILTLFPILFFIPLSFNYQYMYVTPLIYGNAISGKEVSHLWYHDLVYLHFLTFFLFSPG